MDKVKVTPSVSNKIIDNEHRIYNSIRQLSKEIHVGRERIRERLNSVGYFSHGGKVYVLADVSIATRVKFPEVEKEPTLFDELNEEVGSSRYSGHVDPVTGKVIVDEFPGMPAAPTIIEVEKPREDEKEYQEFKKMKEEIKSVNDLPITNYEFKLAKHKNGTRYCVALFSDVHLEQTVEKESVLGNNEYNIEIAKERVKNYFNNLVLCVNDDRVDTVIFACLGDIINGLIHDEYYASNGLMPMESVILGQSLIYSGLRFLLENTKVKKLLFIGVVGNHSRTTKKIWTSGAYKMSYEYLMYQNIKTLCETEGLPIEFVIPNADKAIVDMEDGNRFLFEHGDAVRSTGQGVCGIYPALGRYRLKIKETIHQTKLYIGHYHQCTQMKGVTVNGSIVGQDNFALRNGFAPERPAQMYEVFDTSIGLLNTRQIYCD